MSAASAVFSGWLNVSLPRSRFFGCHATLPEALRDIQKTVARETS